MAPVDVIPITNQIVGWTNKDNRGQRHRFPLLAGLQAGARFRGTMVSFGESVAELGFAPVVARGSENVLL
jgi:hypothetical protein